MKPYAFNPQRPSPIKAAIWEKLKLIPLAASFLNWAQDLKINSKDLGTVPFSPNIWFDCQWMFLEAIFCNPNIYWFVFLKGRQQGISTIALAFDLFMSFKCRDLQGALVCADYKVAGEMREALETMYDNLPLTAKYQKKRSNADYISFMNKSRVKYLFTTAKASKKGNMGRSGATNYAHGTEVAFFANIEDFNAFTATLSDAYQWRRYIWESTANGYNHFYDIVEVAKESNTQKFIFLGWWAKETYRIDDPIEFKKYGYPLQKWEQENVDIVKKLYNYEIDNHQIAWWRKQLAEQMNDRGGMSKEDMMLQEYPYTEFDAFRLSGKRFFQSNTLNKLQVGIPEPIKCLEPIFLTKPEDTTLLEDIRGKIKIWEEYETGATYLLAADPAYGSSADSDNAVITIYKAFKDKLIQVVEYAHNETDVFHFTWLLLSLAGMYSACQIIEMNGPGKVVLQTIDMFKRWIIETKAESNKKLTVYDYAKRLKAEYIYRRVDSMSIGGARHWLTTASAKEHIMFQFQAAAQNEDIIIRSKHLIREMEYVAKNGSAIEATEGKKDDRVVASALACEFWMQSYRARLITFEEYEATREKRKRDAQELQDNPRNAYSQHLVRKMMVA